VWAASFKKCSLSLVVFVAPAVKSKRKRGGTGNRRRAKGL
jgi:hypothetical protein